MFRRRGHSARYRAHIASPEWRRIRLAALERAGHHCVICGRGRAPGRPLQVHHNTYVNLGDEQPEDLAVLCGGRGGCHSLADRQRRRHSRARRDRRRRRGQRRRSLGVLRLPALFLLFAGGLKVASIVLPAVS